MNAEERAREFFLTAPSPDADWYIQEVLIPLLTRTIRAAETESWNDALDKAVDIALSNKDRTVEYVSHRIRDLKREPK